MYFFHPPVRTYVVLLPLGWERRSRDLGRRFLMTLMKFERRGVNAGKLIAVQVDGTISRSFPSSNRYLPVLHLSFFLRPRAFEKFVGPPRTAKAYRKPGYGGVGRNPDMVWLNRSVLAVPACRTRPTGGKTGQLWFSLRSVACYVQRDSLCLVPHHPPIRAS